MKLSEKIRHETRYSVYLKWADEAEQLEAENEKLREALRFPYGGPAHDYLGNDLEDYVTVHKNYIDAIGALLIEEQT